MTQFHGTLTIDNLEEVANLIEKTLAGKQYTFVAANELFGYIPEVRTGQELKPDNPVSFWRDDKNDPPKYGGFNVNDSYGVWGLSTSKDKDKYDPEFNDPYIVVGHNEIKMTLRAPAGHKIYWVAKVESQK